VRRQVAGLRRESEAQCCAELTDGVGVGPGEREMLGVQPVLFAVGVKSRHAVVLGIDAEQREASLAADRFGHALCGGAQLAHQRGADAGTTRENQRDHHVGSGEVCEPKCRSEIVRPRRAERVD
jgi:hypothetical protein